MIGSDLNVYRQMQHHQNSLLAEARKQRLVNAARRAPVDDVAPAAPTLHAERVAPPRRAAAPTPRAPRLRTAAARFGNRVGRMGARLAALDRRFLVR